MFEKIGKVFPKLTQCSPLLLFGLLTIKCYKEKQKKRLPIFSRQPYINQKRNKHEHK